MFVLFHIWYFIVVVLVFFVHIDIICARTVHDTFVFHATIISLYVYFLSFFCCSDSKVTEIH